MKEGGGAGWERAQGVPSSFTTYHGSSQGRFPGTQETRWGVLRVGRGRVAVRTKTNPRPSLSHPGAVEALCSLAVHPSSNS
jgi:hypothetical protein